MYRQSLRIGSLALAGLLVAAAPALAHHRQTAPLLRFTDSGDTTLPHHVGFGNDFALAEDVGAGQTRIFALHRIPHQNIYGQTGIGSPGDNAHPAISKDGKTVAFDTASGLGRDLMVRRNNGALVPLGDGANPAMDAGGKRIGLESGGQVWVLKDGVRTQVSQASGTAANPAITKSGSRLVFDSTAGSASGASQIWVAELSRGTAAAITGGEADSRRPVLSPDGRLVAFESRANLAGGGEDTGVYQIFAYDTVSKTFARVTDDAVDCTGASVIKIFLLDFRIAFACGGEAFYYELRADQRYRLPIDVGNTPEVLLDRTSNFILVSTTADLLGTPGTTTAGHQVYLWNLFKLNATKVPGTALWFPSRGIPPLPGN